MTAPKSRTWISSQTDITRSMSCSTIRIPRPSAASSREQLAERVGLGLVLARGRLVEQQQLRVAGQAAGQLEQPGGAGRDRVGALVGVRRDADPLEQPVDVGRAPAGPGRAARGGCRGRPARCRARVSDPNASSRWKVRPMPRLARRCTGVSGDVAAVEADLAAGRLLQPADHVEAGGLAGAVGPDQAGDPARLGDEATRG